MPKYLIKLTYYAFKTAPLMKYCQHESKNNLGEKKKRFNISALHWNKLSLRIKTAPSFILNFFLYSWACLSKGYILSSLSLATARGEF